MKWTSYIKTRNARRMSGAVNAGIYVKQKKNEHNTMPETENNLSAINPYAFFHKAPIVTIVEQ